MSEKVKSIIFLIFGLIILATGILTKAGTEVIVFGALLTATALGFIIYDIVKAKKSKK